MIVIISFLIPSYPCYPSWISWFIVLEASAGQARFFWSCQCRRFLFCPPACFLLIYYAVCRKACGLNPWPVLWHVFRFPPNLSSFNLNVLPVRPSSSQSEPLISCCLFFFFCQSLIFHSVSSVGSPEASHTTLKYTFLSFLPWILHTHL